MEIVQVRCGYCSNLIALPRESPGQPVRCPYCHQMVLAQGASPLEIPAEPLRPFGDPSQTSADGGQDDSSLAACPSNLAVLDAGPRRSPHASRRGNRWLIGTVILPLLLYSVLATIALVLLWNRVQQMPPHPLEMFPDVEGDTPGVLRNGKKVSPVRGAIAPETVRKLADAQLPDRLRFRLGETLRIGDLEVTARGVERRVVRVFVEGSAQPEPCRHESLVLQLHLQNVSAETTFTPLDNFFDRRWKKGAGPPPLTVLEMAAQRFYGGPAEWSPRGGTGNVRRQWVEGRVDYDAQGLEPGQAMDTLVCTDGDNPRVIQELEQFQGTLLWRVQLRRGLVQVGTRRLPAAAVVGIAFTPREVVPVRAG